MKEVKRERSRSKSPIKHELKVIGKDEHEDKFKHVKSEVVWNSVEFDKKSKKDKFLRLMGANKRKNSESNNEENKQLSEEILKNFKKIETDLAIQFEQGRK